MTTRAVIKNFNVFERVRNGLSMRAIARALHPLVLLAAEEAFRRRIFPATRAAHRATHAGGFQFAPEFMTGGLAAMVQKSMHDRRGPAGEPCPRQCVGRTICQHVRLDRPTYAFPVGQVQRDDPTPRPVSLPNSEALSQSRSVCADMPSSRATAFTPYPSFTCCTGAALNSAAYTWFFILNISSFLRLGRTCKRPAGRRNFEQRTGLALNVAP